MGSTCILKVTDESSSQPGTFQRVYICFAALRMGLKNYCRPIFGLDGCFLKHACGGQLLCAVGRDGNNQMCPIAWAIVEGETRSSWEWFIRILSEDLNMGEGDGWTVISDQQKGLVPAIHAVWPQVEHRQCARHIYSNWRKAHIGRLLQKQFWICVKATSMGDFAREAAVLKAYSVSAYEDFIARDPHTFCKSHFKCHSQCDSVDNNMAETFNSFILLARYKPIISMLEDIRLALMERMQEKRKLLGKFVCRVAPRIHKKMKETYDEQHNCKPLWKGRDDESGFEIIHKGVSHAVHIGNRTCSCRRWELTGIPCAHALSAILFVRRSPEDYISHWYKSDNYEHCYENLLNPVEGSRFWDLEGEDMVVPPKIVKKKLGRPKTARRRDSSEGPRHKNKASRQGIFPKCSHCKSSDHTIRKCPSAPPRQQRTEVSQEERPTAADAGTSNVDTSTNQVRKRGRPKGSKNRIGRSNDEATDNTEPSPAALLIARRSKARGDVENIQVGGGVTGGGRGRGRGRGQGRGLGRGMGNTVRIPEGYGLWQGDNGEMAYRDPHHSQSIILTMSQNCTSHSSNNQM